MNIREIIHSSYDEIRELYRADLGLIFDFAMGSRNSKEFSYRILDHVSDMPNTSSKKAIEDMIAYNNKIIDEMSIGQKIRLETIDLLFNFLVSKEIDYSISKDLYIDFYFLFMGLDNSRVSKEDIKDYTPYMDRWVSGLDALIIQERKANKERIIQRLIEKIEGRTKTSSKYVFPKDASPKEKREQVETWWKDYRFHLSMAIKSPKELNSFLDNSLSEDTMKVFEKAKRKGMPFFYTPYYLSLVSVNGSYDDRSIRSYVLYSTELVETYGEIIAWEKEDIVEPGKPNAAGWLLPNSNNIHRRYPEVAILIPDTRGRACGGLCASCQRMYDFQSSRLNFNLSALAPKESWKTKLVKLLQYFEEDTQLRDLLLTGGDGLMSRNKTLKHILDSIYEMIKRKKEANESRPEGQKYAEIKRIRIGSRLLAYLPMRINDELVEILSEFREKSMALGVEQFLIQTHFQTSLEITTEAKEAIRKINSIGWQVTNQLVYNVAVSRKGHTAKLRQDLNKLGVLPYYTFTVKGFKENYSVFTPISRSMQEKEEGKIYGKLSKEQSQKLSKLVSQDKDSEKTIKEFLDRENLPFIASDRSVINIPAVGKSMTYNLVGITSSGERIHKFDYDATRNHSPIIKTIPDVYILENKSLAQYLLQLENLGEDLDNYSSIWNYTSGETESCFELFKYPDFDYEVTKEVNNFRLYHAPRP